VTALLTHRKYRLAAALSADAARTFGPFSTFRGTDYQQGFYGTGLLESVVRPAVYFAVGAAAAGAVVIRLGRRWLGALASAVLAVLFALLAWALLARAPMRTRPA
jgi:hypothetical protein